MFEELKNSVPSDLANLICEFAKVKLIKEKCSEQFIEKFQECENYEIKIHSFTRVIYIPDALNITFINTRIIKGTVFVIRQNVSDEFLLKLCVNMTNREFLIENLRNIKFETLGICPELFIERNYVNLNDLKYEEEFGSGHIITRCEDDKKLVKYLGDVIYHIHPTDNTKIVYTPNAKFTHIYDKYLINSRIFLIYTELPDMFLEELCLLPDKEIIIKLRGTLFHMIEYKPPDTPPNIFQKFYKYIDFKIQDFIVALDAETERIKHENRVRHGY